MLAPEFRYERRDRSRGDDHVKGQDGLAFWQFVPAGDHQNEEEPIENEGSPDFTSAHQQMINQPGGVRKRGAKVGG
jgi:hypothetical protein